MSRVTKEEVQVMIDESEARIKKYIRKLLEEQTQQPQHNQLMVVSEDERKLIVARAMNGVANYIQKEVLQPMNELKEMVVTTIQQSDGDELVNQYRRRLHDACGGGEVTLKITGRVESHPQQEQHLREFRQKTLFFTDDD